MIVPLEAGAPTGVAGALLTLVTSRIAGRQYVVVDPAADGNSATAAWMFELGDTADR